MRHSIRDILRVLKVNNGSPVFTVQHIKVIAAVDTIGSEKAIRYLSQPRQKRVQRSLRRGPRQDMMIIGRRLPGSFQSRQ